ncbi:MAG: ParB/RepB/Spo0J family partition protein [Candidatus Manganitrophaceae bacterium]|nr:MAG: ParB/RepB/Spo0J family partition protein [Candidatus Manganitrophaceae bacterium]
MQQRKALGKGLGLTALVPPAEPPKGEVREIEIGKIIPNRYQPRQHFDPEALASLAASLKSHGLIQPITVRKEESGQYELIAGERRWRAAQLAGFAAIPAIVKSVQEQELMEWALLENVQREDLNPIEKAQAYQRLLTEFSLTQEAIAARMGIDRSTVANFLRLLQLPERLWGWIADGTLTMGHAKALLSLEKKEDQLRVAEEIKTKGWSVRQIEALVQKIKREARPDPKGSATPSPEVAELEGRLRHALGTKVRLVQQGKGGEIRIEYYSLEDLDRILDKLTGPTVN